MIDDQLNSDSNTNMTTGLSNEEFQRLQESLLELKSANYSLEEQHRKAVNELAALRLKNDELEKQARQAQVANKINPLTIARNLATRVDNKLRATEGQEAMVREQLLVKEQLAMENEQLMKRIEAQERDFRVINETLRQEIAEITQDNEKLLARVGTLEKDNKRLNQLLKFDKQQHQECDLGLQESVDQEEVKEIEIIPVKPAGEEESDDTRRRSRSDPEQAQQQLSFAVLVEKEKLESRVSELSATVDRLEKDRDRLEKEKLLMMAQLEECDTRKATIETLETKLEAANKLIESRSQLVGELRSQLEQNEVKWNEEKEQMTKEFETRTEESDASLGECLRKIDELTEENKILSENLKELSGVVSENEKLSNELASFKEELAFCKQHNEERIKSLQEEHEEAMNQLMAKNDEEVAKIVKEVDACQRQLEEQRNQTQDYKQQLIDMIEERKIHDKKGVVMVKELKRQLHSERKRADKLQEKLQELLNESTTTISAEIRSRHNASAASSNGNNNNDSSSVGSWSFMSAKDVSNRRTSSVHSGSDGGGGGGRDPTPPSTFRPINENDETRSQNSSVLEQENSELVTRITHLQQEKWSLEERINQLELGNADLNEDVNRKNRIIQFYCMEGRSDPTHLHQHDKLTVKRVVDFIKDKGDENLREINRKVQRMLEETLTKNMHLQQNLETLSDEVVRLKKLVVEKEC